MNVELKKMKKTIYITVVIVAIAIATLFWFLTRSFVTIDVSPRIASFWLDNKELSVVAGEVNINTTVGNHLIRIESDGYIGNNQVVNFNRGFNKKISISLRKTPDPTIIKNDSSLLTRGADFNDGYYLSNNTVYKLKVGLDSQKNISVIENQAITQNKITDVKEIIWSPNRDLALLRHSNQITLFDFMKYDFVNQTESPWGGNDIGSIAWSPDNSKIAYYYAPVSGERSLIFANITNSSIERVYSFIDTGIENPILKWSPDSEWLMLLPQNKDTKQNKINLFNSYSRTMKTINDAGNQIAANFSPDGNKIIYATKGSEALPEISVMNIDGSGKKDLGIQANPQNIIWTKDSKNIIITTVIDNESLIYQYNIEALLPSGFEIFGLAKKIDFIEISDDGKLLLYEADGKILALKLSD